MIKSTSEKISVPYPVRTVSIPLAGDAAIHITVPGHPEALLDAMTDEEYEKDHFLPYWAEQWPSSVPLVQFLLQQNIPEKWYICELGCGLGTVSAALTCLFSTAVTFATDIAHTGCRFTSHNIKSNGGIPRVFCSDWRHPPLNVRFDAVVASDVLYEERWITPIIDGIETLLKPDGRAWIADPCRRFWSLFKEQLTARGFHYSTCSFPDSGTDNGAVEILEITRS